MVNTPLFYGLSAGSAAVPSAAARDVGWATPYLQQAVRSNAVVLPLTRCRTMPTTDIVRLGYGDGENGYRRMNEDLRIAIQGRSDKQLAFGTVGAGAVNVDITATASFGFVVRRARSIGDWGRNPFLVTLGRVAAASPPAITIACFPTEEVSEFMVLSVVSQAGLGKIAPSTDARITLPAGGGSGLITGDVVTIETLTSRDLGLT